MARASAVNPQPHTECRQLSIDAMENTPITRANPSRSSPLHRHQSSLEGIIDFSTRTSLSADQRARATHRFNHIVRHFELQSGSVGSRRQRDTQYSRPLLVRYTYEYARSEESRDIFLRAFFQSIQLSLDAMDDGDIDLGNEQVETDLRSALFAFSDYLLDNFFLPCTSITCLFIFSFSLTIFTFWADFIPLLVKASTKKTPQPSPAYHSAIQRAQGAGQGFVGTPEHISALRGACLVRDRHRCVISRRFDFDEALKRIESYGDDARDDDGVLLSEDTNPMNALEVAHILPHSLTKADPSAPLV